MFRWITLARSWHPLVRIGIATIAVAATTGLQLPVEVIFPGQPFLLYFVAVVASASALGRTAGFVAVAETSIASLLFYDPVYALKVTHAVDLLAIQIYAVVAALSVEAFVASLIVRSPKNRRRFQRERRQRRVLPTARSNFD